jgi:hypothetical protein
MRGWADVVPKSKPIMIFVLSLELLFGYSSGDSLISMKRDLVGSTRRLRLSECSVVGGLLRRRPRGSRRGG